MEQYIISIGTYEVTLTDAYGCLGTTSATLEGNVQTEIPYNGIDDDCNPATRNDDLDQNGFLAADDCDDNNASINSQATEIADRKN